jgi:hypothetical protein
MHVTRCCRGRVTDGARLLPHESLGDQGDPPWRSGCRPPSTAALRGCRCRTPMGRTWSFSLHGTDDGQPETLQSLAAVGRRTVANGRRAMDGKTCAFPRQPALTGLTPASMSAMLPRTPQRLCTNSRLPLAAAPTGRCRITERLRPGDARRLAGPPTGDNNVHTIGGEGAPE